MEMAITGGWVKNLTF